MHCKNCNEPIEEAAVFCGNCGKPLTASNVHDMVGVQAASYKQDDLPWPIANKKGVAQLPFPAAQPFPRSNLKTPAPINQPTPVPFPLQTPRPLQVTPAGTRRNRAFLIMMLALLGVGLLTGTVAILQNKHLMGQDTPPSPPMQTVELQGSGAFSASQNSQGQTDSLTISVSGLAKAPTNTHYAAWLLNEATEQTLALGALSTPTAGKQLFALHITQPGKNLLGQGNKLEITQETATTTLPTGHILLTATFPPLAFIHIKHLLVSFPTTPANIGLLVGLLDQVQRLDEQATLLKNATGHPRTTQCIAQNILNLLEGTSGPLAHPLAVNCSALNVTASGDGFGLLGQNQAGYVASAAAHASLAATQPDATDTIRVHAQQVITAMDSIKGWLTTIDQDAQTLLENPADTAAIQELVSHAEYALNGNQTLSGAATAYRDGQLMATLTFVART